MGGRCNVAVNQPAMQSSTAHGAYAGAANDGETRVGHAMQSSTARGAYAGAVVDGETRVGADPGGHTHSETLLEESPWWVVDLAGNEGGLGGDGGDDVLVRSVSIWRQMRLGVADAYPQATPAGCGRGMRITLYSGDGARVYEGDIRGSAPPSAHTPLDKASAEEGDEERCMGVGAGGAEGG
ncbi:hypothetical protein T484DRAFT_1913377, partial [Baffinella frigidus]